MTEIDKMLDGEVPFDDPHDPAWPDDVPVQSRYGSPADFVPAQTVQVSPPQLPVDGKKPVAGPEAEPVKAESAKPVKAAPVAK